MIQRLRGVYRGAWMEREQGHPGICDVTVPYYYTGICFLSPTAVCFTNTVALFILYILCDYKGGRATVYRDTQ